jgi:hypothetical protein
MSEAWPATWRRWCGAAAIALGLLLGAGPAPAAAAVGDPLREVNLPAGGGPSGDFCLSGIGTSVAVVPGGVVGFPQFPILVVTSCFAGAGIAAEQA